MTIRILILASVAVALSAQCIEVAGDRILATDLAKSQPAFATVAPEFAIGLAPRVGAQRVLSANELQKLAANHGLELKQAGDICIVRSARTLSADEIMSALRAVLDDPQVAIAILDYPHGPLPSGKLEFPMASLSSPGQGGSGAAMWRGRIRSEGGATTPVWVRVRITKKLKQVVAKSAIPAGQSITADLVEVRERESFPRGNRGWSDVEQVVGREASRSIPAGTVIEQSMVRAGAAVKRGEPIRIAIRNGGAALLFDGKAEVTARPGDRILVRSPFHGRLVPAVVREDGIAEIELSRIPNVQSHTTSDRSSGSDPVDGSIGAPQAAGTAAR